LSDPEHYQKLRLGAWEMAKKFTLERHLDQLELILAQPQLMRLTGATLPEPSVHPLI
jgi:hypothetical protein